MNVIQALTMFMPIVTALMNQAEATGASGPDKHAAVATAAEQQYKALQGSVKELRAVPWEMIAPLIVPVETGLIAMFAGFFNRLRGKIWGMFSSPAPVTPAAPVA
jgi:hypothetical protein